MGVAMKRPSTSEWDESDTSEEWDWEESEGEGKGPGDSMYHDYRQMQRMTFLVSKLKEQEEMMKKEMGRVMELMERLGVRREEEQEEGKGEAEEFGIDCHDLSLENVFVDEQDHSKIACIIDWEVTMTRPPLGMCTHLHLPAILPLHCQDLPYHEREARTVTLGWDHQQVASQPRADHGGVAAPRGRWGAAVHEEEEKEWFRSYVQEGEEEGGEDISEDLARLTGVRWGWNEEGRDGGAWAPAVPLVKKVVEVEKEWEKELVPAEDIGGGVGRWGWEGEVEEEVGGT
ncbi:uncharacterized protein LAESUDRAFT_793343 [Laetiporus sulphureus 93-53]|uniref:Aminoglycoside phosphotransferase domain-containing protein n=1 Tax=Laetiporus sulphureus 93-53 TaxID=1314785 RepID=A0A165GGB8_9APHY|nr:uncharacterized protein LAESUDRAFT_793343 [Laetiporus sulphureus 93-53]KZT10307.1 hypothetical protein LAESUDRAFT_793343 [Laetiporus sulphureus 93-53]